MRADATAGNETVEKLESQMNFITDSTKNMGTIINELKASSNEITHIIEMVKQIESDVDALLKVIQTIGSDTIKVSTTAENLHQTALQL